jgi:hypothetical protein
MGNLSFEHEGGGWKEATRWLSLSPDTFKPGRAQLSALIISPALISIRGVIAPQGRRRHCEERSDEAIQSLIQTWIASLRSQ